MNPPTDPEFTWDPPHEGCWSRICGAGHSNFHKQFMPTARIKFAAHQQALATLQNRFVRYTNTVKRAKERTQKYVRITNRMIYFTATLLMVVTLFNGTFSEFEASDTAFNMADKILTMLFVAMFFGRRKLQLVEKASLYTSASNMLDSMGTYLLEGAGLYRKFETPTEALPVFWTQFEALTQAIGHEHSQIVLKGNGQIEGMQLRLVQAMARSTPEHAMDVYQAFMVPTPAHAKEESEGGVQPPPGMSDAMGGNDMFKEMGFDHKRLQDIQSKREPSTRPDAPTDAKPTPTNTARVTVEV